MMEWLAQLQPWHWIVLCLVLLALEALGTGGFLLGAAAAAGTVATMLWLLADLSWAGQLIAFAVATLVYSVAYWRLFRHYNEQTEQPQLNDRASQLIGRRWSLAEALPEGESRVQIGDTFWRARCAAPLAVGTLVEVIDSDGMVLLLAAVNPKG
ncbi:NfeD family protein [uncultured Ferrimonas sp.]|uniref:NfeD family protein n=1 Tax=uncultured Ferrimonas sp. TaxID=432640 RepID=UPI00261793A8|nr:NfeD family protein [uncultured Ferrimonas sp.]